MESTQTPPARAERRTKQFDFVAFLSRENAVRIAGGKPLMGQREREYWRAQYPYARKTA